MEGLPLEITVNILSRLPFKSTARCRCVSKKWLSIISDSTFSSTQLTQLSRFWPDIAIFVGGGEPRMCYMEDNEQVFNQMPLKPFKIIDHDIPYTICDDPVVLGLCNGYICLFEENVDDDSVSLHLFNPITEEYSDLPDFTIPHFTIAYEQNWLLSGLGFEESTMKFKLVVVLFYEGNDASQAFNNEVHVLTLGSNTWRRKIGTVPDVLIHSLGNCSVALLNNCLHWITFDRDSPKDGPIIVSFNMDVEEFGFVPSPETGRLADREYGLVILEEHLSVVEHSPECYLQIWVMEEYMVKDTWVKKFSIQQDLVSPRGLRCKFLELIKLCKNGELLLRCDYMYLVLYNTTSGKYRFVRVEGVEGDHYYEAYPFVGSLTPLKLIYGVESTSKET